MRMTRRELITTLAVVAVAGTSACTQSVRQTPAPTGPPPTRSEILRGDYGRYRANNDLSYYHLDVRVDPERKFLSGKNTIRFRMLSDDNRIQIDLHPALAV